MEHKPKEFYRLAIIGSGPCGLSAAVNAASEGLSTIVLERSPVIGGQAKYSSRIENYPGFVRGLTGESLTSKFAKQAMRFGSEVFTGCDVDSISLDGKYKTIALKSGVEIACKACLIAAGLTWKELDNPGISEFRDNGVYYGAMPSEAERVINKNVVVIGGANSAAQCALNLSTTANKVTMLVRDESLAHSASDYLVKRITANDKIEVITKASIESVVGHGSLEYVRAFVNNEIREIFAHAVFVFIGSEPKCGFVTEAIVDKDEHGFVISDEWHCTKTNGIFVAGDIRHGSVKRVASGVGEGARAVQFIHKFLA